MPKTPESLKPYEEAGFERATAFTDWMTVKESARNRGASEDQTRLDLEAGVAKGIVERHPTKVDVYRGVLVGFIVPPVSH